MRDGGAAPTAASFASFVPYRAAQPRSLLRLLCFPHAGGAASAFHGWQSRVGEEIEVWAIQLPGREARRHEAPHHDIAPAVEELVAALGSRLDQPFALFGHSAGADLAFALALELRRRGLRSPEHLVVAAQVPPHDRVVADPLHVLDDAALIARLKRHGGIPGEILAEPEGLRLAIPRLRADLEVSETFTVTPADRLDVPITAFAGLHDRVLHGPDVERWAELTTAGFHLEWWPGDHFFVHDAADEVVAQLAATLLASTGRQADATAATPAVRGDATRAPGPEPARRTAPGALSRTTRDVTTAVAEVAPALAIELDDNFFDAGIGSLALVRLQVALSALGHEVEITDLFRWPTIRRLAAGLTERHEEAAELRQPATER